MGTLTIDTPVSTRKNPQEEIVGFLDNIRANVGLERLGKYESNFIFQPEERDLEYIHILRRAFDDMFTELESKHLSQNRFSRDKQGRVHFIKIKVN